MKKQLIGWLFIAVAMVWPFNKIWFQLEEISNFEKTIYFVLSMTLLAIGYVMVGKAKEANKKSHH